MESAAVKKIAECLWEPLKEHATYLLCYSQNIDKLQTQVQELEVESSAAVEVARQQGQRIHDHVNKWLTELNTVKSKEENIVERSADVNCWNGWCWNPVRCYGLGKEAAEMIAAVDELRKKWILFKSVSGPPSPPTTESLYPSNGFHASASTEKLMTDVRNALKDDGIQIIGVHGMGGVGKTTLMKEVLKQAERDNLLDKVVMVTVSQNVKIKEIRKEIGDKLGFTIAGEDEAVRAARLSEKLKEVAKILVILDDLWEGLDLNDVRIPHGDQHRGCKVIITTRDSEVCNQMRSQKNIEVKPLSEKDSWDLFLEKAELEANSPDLSNVARKIVGECKGLPLAIIVLGSLLRGKRVTFWRTILKKLESSDPSSIRGLKKEVFQSIKVSFDYLEDGEDKMCFLLCCLFPEDYNIHLSDVTWIMVGERKIGRFETLEEAENKVYLLFHNLKASGLLLDGDREGCVKMHDIVRDVAIWISSNEYGFYSRAGVGLTEWPSSMDNKIQRISLIENKIRVFPEVPPDLPNLRTLLLDGDEGLETIPDGFFSAMEALEVLNLRWTRISSLTSILCLTNLRVLLMQFCQSFHTLSGIGALKSLEILKVSCQSKHDRDDALPAEVGELINLRWLQLPFSFSRMPQNVISQLFGLEELDMVDLHGSEDTSSGPFAELAFLPRLRKLRLVVTNWEFFSQDLGPDVFNNLVDFSIYHRQRFPPERRGNRLTITTSTAPTWAARLLPKTHDLCFHFCPKMECLGADGGNIPTGVFCNVQRIQLVDMMDLCKIYHGAPSECGFLGKLAELIVKGCNKLTEIFSFDLMSQLEQLETLQVSNCNQLLCVFHNNGATGACRTPMLLPMLESVELNKLPSLVSVWEGNMPLKSLRELTVSSCDKLTCLFSWRQVQSLESLETLQVSNCNQLLCVFHNNGATGGCQTPMLLPKLKSVQLNGLPSLVSVWEGDMPLKSLWELTVSDCDKLTCLFSWRQVQSLESLEQLYISNCPDMVAIIMSDQENSEQKAIKHDTSMFPKLNDLYLRSMKIASFDAEGAALFDWPSLELLHIEDCPNMKKIPLSRNGGQKLYSIEGSEEWFQALEWDDESNKSRLQTLFTPS